jgi:hypothetical protein
VDVDGYVILDKISNEAFHAKHFVRSIPCVAYHEGKEYQNAIEKHKKRFEQYPEISLADGIYANRENRKWAKEKGLLTPCYNWTN